MTTLTTIVRTAILATVLTGTVPAVAHAEDAAPSVQISVAGIDFTSPAAVRTLRHRLIFAAREMCNHNDSENNLPSASERACFNAAMAKVDAEIASRQALAQGHGNAQVARANPADDAAKRDH